MDDLVKYFNQAPTKCMATVDAEGNPNICFCGSALMINAQTVQVLYGYFHKSYANLQRNPAAVFLASKGVPASFWKHYEATGEKLCIAGYRYDCTFSGESADAVQLARSKKRLLPVIGSRVISGFKSMLVFKVTGIREINI